MSVMMVVAVVAMRLTAARGDEAARMRNCIASYFLGKTIIDSNGLCVQAHAKLDFSFTWQ